MSLSEHKDGVGASTMEPDCHILPALECGGYEWDREGTTVSSVSTLEEESKFELAAKLESVDEIRNRRFGGGSEENGYPSSMVEKINKQHTSIIMYINRISFSLFAHANFRLP